MDNGSLVLLLVVVCVAGAIYASNLVQQAESRAHRAEAANQDAARAVAEAVNKERQRMAHLVVELRDFVVGMDENLRDKTGSGLNSHADTVAVIDTWIAEKRRAGWR